MPLSGWPMYNCKASATFKSMVVVISDLENLANLGLVSGRGQRIKEDKLFKRENLVNFSLQTSINVFFFGSQRFEKENCVYICVQTYIITFFIDSVIERPVTSFGELCLLFPLISKGMNKILQD